jgi:hypothetical protein
MGRAQPMSDAYGNQQHMLLITRDPDLVKRKPLGYEILCAIATANRRHKPPVRFSWDMVIIEGNYRSVLKKYVCKR